MIHTGTADSNNGLDIAKLIYNSIYWIHSTIRWKKKKHAQSDQ